MEMYNPPHPGLSLRHELEEMNIPVISAAKSIGVTRQQLYRVMRGECAITPEMALRLEKSLGGTARHWLAMQTGYDLWQLKNTKLKPAPKKIEWEAA